MISAKRKRCNSRLGGCGEYFRPQNTLQQACGVACAINIAARKTRRDREKKRLDVKRQRLAEKRAFRENDIRHVAKQAKAYLHKWIVAVRDRDLPCVSSGRTTSAVWNAGHYRPSGSNSALRYDPDNIHKQSCEDNCHRSGNLIAYRAELIRRIGADAIDRLESTNEPKKWRIEELREIRDQYAGLLREAGIPLPTGYTLEK